MSPNPAQLPIIFEKLQSELEQGRIVGPFADKPFPNLFISPIYAVPKKAPGKYRIIHDLSHPPGKAVNNGIPKELSSVSYANIDNAIRHIKLLGPGCFLAKTDVESAFRIVPIHPNDHHLLGFYLDNGFYYDRCLPMGASISCSIFEAISSALEWIAVNKLNIRFPTHILDDFLFANHAYSSCERDLVAFSNMCQEVGVPLSEEKTYYPDTTMSFLGIELDTRLMEARLPIDKLQKCKETIQEFLLRSSVSLKQVQSLVGLLNHVCQVVVPGRAFLRRLIDLTRNRTYKTGPIHINSGVRLDLQMWGHFLDTFNGKSFFVDDQFTTDSTLNLYTDAAGSLGYGAVYGTEWLYGAWPQALHSTNITILEFYPIVLAFHIWGKEWANQSILLHTDNLALVHIINKQTSRNPRIMPLVRRFVLISLRRNIRCRAEHIPGTHNTMADCLSRLQVERFRRKYPHMATHPVRVPPHLLPSSLID